MYLLERNGTYNVHVSVDGGIDLKKKTKTKMVTHCLGSIAKIQVDVQEKNWHD